MFGGTACRRQDPCRRVTTSHAGRVTDRYGIPENMFGEVPEDFYALVGRIALVSTLVEDRLLGILWALDDQPQPTHAGHSASRIKELVEARLHKVSSPVADRIQSLLDRISKALERRHALVHSLWPNPTEHQAEGWRSRRLPKALGGGSEIVWTQTSVDALQVDLRDLIDLTEEALIAMTAVWSERGRQW